jgi:serine/threonine protein phosphatase PrpC
MYVANVGDSRAIVAQKVGDGSNSKVQAFPLSDDQTPYRKVWRRYMGM